MVKKVPLDYKIELDNTILEIKPKLYKIFDLIEFLPDKGNKIILDYGKFVVTIDGGGDGGVK